MAKKVFILVKTNVKEEVPYLGVDHAMGAMATLIGEEEFEATVAFVGSGVLNCIKGQKFLDIYNVESIEDVIKLALGSDVKIYICKEDMEKYKISEDSLVDAKDMGIEATIEVKSWNEIQEEMKKADYVFFF